MLSEFKLQCSENGTWAGFVPDCVPFKCPWPNIINNGKLLFKMQNNDTIKLTKIRTSNYTNIEITSEENDDVVKEERTLEDQFTIGSQILVECDIGYKIIGDSVRICTESGQWSSLSFCELQECPILNHPFFHVLNEKINPNSTKTIFYKTNSTMWKDDENKKLNSKIPFNGTYKNLKYFVEGYTYMEKIILKCNNTGEIKLNSTNNHNSTSDLTWFCNEHGKWEIVNTRLNNTIVDLLFNNDLDDICQESMCSIIIVRIIFFKNNYKFRS